MLELLMHLPIEGHMTPQDINANYIADLYGETYLAEDNPAPRKRLMIGALFPGLAVVGIASVAATWFSEHYAMPVILVWRSILYRLNKRFTRASISAAPRVCGGASFCWGPR
jgi:hypothetical protein